MIPESHHGAWKGRSRLWFGPGAEPESCDATARVTPTELSYDWSQGGKPHHGSYTFTFDGDTVHASFVDTFHSQTAMPCVGTRREGTIAVTGSYAAPPGPDWGWRTEVDTTRPDTLVVRMLNLMPGGPEDLAVEMVLTR